MYPDWVETALATISLIGRKSVGETMMTMTIKLSSENFINKFAH